MMNRTERRARLGFVLVILGLLVQIAAAFFWSPGAFIVSAALGVPLVLAGALLIVVSARRAVGRTPESPEAKGDVDGPA